MPTDPFYPSIEGKQVDVAAMDENGREDPGGLGPESFGRAGTVAPGAKETIPLAWRDDKGERMK